MSEVTQVHYPTLREVISVDVVFDTLPLDHTLELDLLTDGTLQIYISDDIIDKSKEELISIVAENLRMLEDENHGALPVGCIGTDREALAMDINTIIELLPEAVDYLF